MLNRIAILAVIITIGLVGIRASSWISIHDGIIICGSGSFVHQTNTALAALKQQCPDHFEFVAAYLDLILPGRVSRVNVGLPVSICTVAARTRNAGIIWYTCSLAHEAYHVYLSRTQSGAPTSDPLAEQLCLRFQKLIASELNAEPYTLHYLTNVASLRYWEIPESAQRW